MLTDCRAIGATGNSPGEALGMMANNRSRPIGPTLPLWGVAVHTRYPPRASPWALFGCTFGATSCPGWTACGTIEKGHDYEKR